MDLIEARISSVLKSHSPAAALEEREASRRMCMARMHVLGRMHKMLRTVTTVERYQSIIQDFR